MKHLQLISWYMFMTISIRAMWRLFKICFSIFWYLLEIKKLKSPHSSDVLTNVYNYIPKSLLQMFQYFLQILKYMSCIRKTASFSCELWALNLGVSLWYSFPYDNWSESGMPTQNKYGISAYVMNDLGWNHACWLTSNRRPSSIEYGMFQCMAGLLANRMLSCPPAKNLLM